MGVRLRSHERMFSANLASGDAKEETWSLAPSVQEVPVQARLVWPFVLSLVTITGLYLMASEMLKRVMFTRLEVSGERGR